MKRNKKFFPTQLGLTLIELMIAMVLGLILLGGVIQIFLGGRAAYGEIQRFTSLQENLGFLSDFLGNELRGSEFITWNAGTLAIWTSNTLATPREGPFGCTAYQVASSTVRCLNSITGTSEPVVGNANDFPFSEMRVTCPDASGTWPANDNVCANSGPTGVRITFVFDSAASGEVRPHELNMTFALRNNVLR